MPRDLAIWRKVWSAIHRDQRGEAGPNIQPIPGSGSGSGSGTPPAEPSWESATPDVATIEGGTPPAVPSSTPSPAPPAVEPAPSAPVAPVEGQQPPAATPAPAPSSPPKYPKEVEEELTRLRADIRTHRQMSEFYQKNLNDKISGPPGSPPTHCPGWCAIRAAPRPDRSTPCSRFQQTP